MTTGHARERSTERIVMTLGIDAERIAVERAERYASTSATDTAVRVYRSAIHGLWAGESNGDTVIAIIRSRRVITYMLRRSSQPFAPSAFGVTRVEDAS